MRGKIRGHGIQATMMYETVQTYGHGTQTVTSRCSHPPQGNTQMPIPAIIPISVPLDAVQQNSLSTPIVTYQSSDPGDTPPPFVFTGDHTKTKEFLTQWELYYNLNHLSNVMGVPYS